MKKKAFPQFPGDEGAGAGAEQEPCGHDDQQWREDQVLRLGFPAHRRIISASFLRYRSINDVNSIREKPSFINPEFHQGASL